MSVILALEAIGLVGRLLFDVVKWAREDTIAAENNRELDTGDKKHKHVAQNILHKIVNYDLRPDYEKLDPHLVQAAKEEAIKHIDRHITDTVSTKNETGEFVK
jgi:hypothetical protein